MSIDCRYWLLCLEITSPGQPISGKWQVLILAADKECPRKPKPLSKTKRLLSVRPKWALPEPFHGRFEEIILNYYLLV